MTNRINTAFCLKLVEKSQGHARTRHTHSFSSCRRHWYQFWEVRTAEVLDAPAWVYAWIRTQIHVNINIILKESNWGFNHIVKSANSGGPPPWRGSRTVSCMVVWNPSFDYLFAVVRVIKKYKRKQSTYLTQNGSIKIFSYIQYIIVFE